MLRDPHGPNSRIYQRLLVFILSRRYKDDMVGRKSARTHRRLLEAAGRVVARDGANKLTLEAVAREAGMSKGSLLYHFRTKDALVSAMVGDLIDAFARSMEEGLSRGGDAGPGRRVRAYVEATFAEGAEEGERRDLEVGVGLLAAVANDPTLLDPLREAYRGWQSVAEDDGVDPASATVARLAADGLWMAELLGMAPPSGELRQEVMEELLSIARQTRGRRGS